MKLQHVVCEYLQTKIYVKSIQTITFVMLVSVSIDVHEQRPSCDPVSFAISFGCKSAHLFLFVDL